MTDDRRPGLPADGERRGSQITNVLYLDPREIVNVMSTQAGRQAILSTIRANVGSIYFHRSQCTKRLLPIQTGDAPPACENLQKMAALRRPHRSNRGGLSKEGQS